VSTTPKPSRLQGVGLIGTPADDPLRARPKGPTLLVPLSPEFVRNVAQKPLTLIRGLISLGEFSLCHTEYLTSILGFFSRICEGKLKFLLVLHFR